MKGITHEKFDDCSVFYINDFSDELKQELNKTIIEICHGNRQRNGIGIHSHSNTINELLKRYPDSDNKQKGFIGELLLHLVVRIFHKNYEVASPFFNKEKAESAKNGFDLILLDKDDNTVWIVESKSGTVSEYGLITIDEKIDERLYEAHRDLRIRLNEDNNTIWLNAYNDVILSMDESDEKDVVTSILARTHSRSEECNTILAGTVFHDINSKFTASTVLDRKIKIEKSNIYNSVRVIAIQKETYERVAGYLTELG